MAHLDRALPGAMALLAIACGSSIRYALAQRPFTDTHYYPWPSKVYLHDNTYMTNGTMPDLASTIGVILSTGMSAYPGGDVPDVLWDGIADPSLPARRRPTHPPCGAWAM